MAKNDHTVVIALAAIVIIIFTASLFNQGITGNATIPVHKFKGVSDCSDSERANDNFLYGEIVVETRDDTEIWPDECVDDKTLVQYYCRPGDGYGKFGRHCDYGCKDGVCLKLDDPKVEITYKKRIDNDYSGGKACQDNEKQNDRYEKGTLIFRDTSGSVEISDHCRGKVVIQYSCLSAKRYSATGSLCLKGCVDGACIR
jgi:hypothetical protein